MGPGLQAKALCHFLSVLPVIAVKKKPLSMYVWIVARPELTGLSTIS